VSFLADLIKSGKLQVEKKAEDVAIHHPCKTIHNDEHGTMDELMAAAGVSISTAGKSPDIPRCCGGGGGGFLWDSPAKINRNRWDQLKTETGKNTVVTGCPGCHRMLAVAKDEESSLKDVANVLFERLPKKEDGENPES
jgi:Fe-S oxidoreductase